VLPAVGVIFGIGAISAAMTTSNGGWWQAGGFAGAISVVGLWGATELGPPTPEPSSGANQPATEAGLRQKILRKLLLLPELDDAEYLPVQRGMFDMAAFTPSLLTAALAADELGRPGVAVLLWGVLLLPAVLIMTVRKHEVRLLNSYRDQNMWLSLNKSKLKTLAAQNEFGPDDWY
jgi:hypothetical protein